MPDFEDETHFYPLRNGDPHYEAIGRVASAWSYFEFHVNKFIWGLAAKDDERGACLTSNMVSLNMRINAMFALLDLELLLKPEEKGHDGRSKKNGVADLRDQLKRMVDKRLEPLTRERNRIIHDPWLYGKRTGAIAQIRATAHKKLDYAFRPASLSETNTTHKKILRLDQDFQLLAAKIQALLRLQQQIELLEPPAGSAPPTQG